MKLISNIKFIYKFESKKDIPNIKKLLDNVNYSYKIKKGYAGLMFLIITTSHYTNDRHITLHIGDYLIVNDRDEILHIPSLSPNFETFFN